MFKNLSLEKIISPLSIIFIAILLRLLPHAPNFAPVGALAFFGGAYLFKKYSIFIVFVAMLISDYLLLYVNPYSPHPYSFDRLYPLNALYHSTTVFVYGSFLLYVLIGWLISKKKTFLTVGVGALVASIQFFLITNAAVWLNGAYARDISGLFQSYVMGIPFFRGTLLGDLFYTGVFFGGYELAMKIVNFRKPALSA